VPIGFNGRARNLKGAFVLFEALEFGEIFPFTPFHLFAFSAGLVYYWKALAAAEAISAQFATF
jgi:hypothetical protein